MTYQQEAQYYPANMSLPGSRRCDPSKIGDFCYKKGDRITADDTLVSQYTDVRVLKGFQHARDGFHVIYDMGERKNGYDRYLSRSC